MQCMIHVEYRKPKPDCRARAAKFRGWVFRLNPIAARRQRYTVFRLKGEFVNNHPCTILQAFANASCHPYVREIYRFLVEWEIFQPSHANTAIRVSFPAGVDAEFVMKSPSAGEWIYFQEYCNSPTAIRSSDSSSFARYKLIYVSYASAWFSRYGIRFRFHIS